MIKYEYNAINNPQFLGDRLLNKLGEDGWELVSHAYNSNTCDHFYTFKREKDEVVKPQDTPAVCEYSGLRPIEGYKEEEIENKEDIDREMKIERGDINFMYKWIRSKSGK